MERRILWLTDLSPNPSSNAGCPRLYELSRNLRGVHHLICFDTIDPSVSLTQFDRVQCVKFPSSPVGFLNRLVHRLTARSFIDERVRRPKFVREVMELVCKTIEQVSPDIIYVRGERGALMLPKFSTCPVIIDLVDSLELLYERDAEVVNNWKLKRDLLSEASASGKLQAELVKRSDMTFLISQPDLERVRKRIDSTKLRVFPNGVNTEFFTKQSIESDKQYLVFFGVLDYRPNEDAAIYLIQEIFPLVRKQLPNLLLKIVGPGPSSRLIEAARIDGVEVTGFVEDIRPHLSSASAFICPMRIGAGMKNKILVAMAMGLPIVATELAMDGVDATVNEHYLCGKDADQISQEVVKLLGSSTIASRLSMNGRELVETRYSWQARTNELEQIINDLTSAVKSSDNHNRLQ